MNRMPVLVGLVAFTRACGGFGAPAGKVGGLGNAATRAAHRPNKRHFAFSESHLQNAR